MILVALTIVQCTFVVGGAVAEADGYHALISDYFSFNAPTRIAACGGDFAVYDGGRIELFRKGVHTSFATEAETCDKLVLTTDGVFLLMGVDDGAPIILSYDVSGVKKGYVLPAENVLDICASAEIVYTLSGTHVSGYDTSDGTEVENYDLPMMSFSIRIAVDGDVSYFHKLGSKLIKRENDELTAIGEIGEIGSMSARGGKLYYTKNDEIYLYGSASALIGKNGLGDAAFTAMTDFAVGDYIYLLDGEEGAVKVYGYDGSYRKMIGSYGYDLGRLNAPVALTVSGEKVYVADAKRGSEFGETLRALKGRQIVAPTDIAVTDDVVYVADNGTLYEYNSALLYQKESSVETNACRYVTASPNGTIYAASGKTVCVRKAGESSFKKKMTVEQEITGMSVGMGGNILYLLTGGVLSAYSESSVLIATLDTGLAVKGFAVDYRGNVYVVSGARLYRYERIPTGYAEPVRYDLPTGYASYGDLALNEKGDAYLIADHNVLIYPKAAFGVSVKEDGEFEDHEPSVHPRFVAEVIKDTAIAYVSPGNFEDITIIPIGTRLMCYATVDFSGAKYLRAEWTTGTVYLAKSDVTVYEEGAAPFSRARCLLSVFGENVVGVNIYREPSYLEIEKGTAPLFAALGKENVFDVLSVVAVDQTGKDAWGFYRVSYQGTEGYVRADEVVSVDADPQPMPKTYDVQVKSDGLGKTVSIYKEASRESEVVATLSDGSRIKSLEPIDQNKEFTMVLYEGEVCYVLTSNIGQGGLSGGQILAIVLSVVVFVGSVLTILILRANKKHKRER